jgi:hypothetical protein
LPAFAIRMQSDASGSPAPLHRRHWNVYVIDVELDHVPLVVRSTCPTRGDPETAGSP